MSRSYTPGRVDAARHEKNDITDCSKCDPRNPSWYTKRMDHALMPPFDGFCPTLDEAKRACETDFIALARADRWLNFMRDNDPAAGGVTE